MPHTHFVLQGKGGVGKSFVANLLAQSFVARGTPALCIDTDPVNGTLHAFTSLGVQRINILEGDEINTRAFDTLIEKIAQSKTDVIVDNGASSFVPLSHYLISNEVAAILQELGHSVVVQEGVAAGLSPFLQTTEKVSGRIDDQLRQVPSSRNSAIPSSSTR